MSVATEKANPFPDFLVSRITGEVGVQTAETGPIKQSHELLKTYLTGWQNQAFQPLFVGVKGDWGTGKTHLLLDAAATVATPRDGVGAPFMIRTACVEKDVLAWYRTGIGRQLDKDRLPELATRVFARAGQDVAQRTTMTAPADAALASNPRAIQGLVRSNLINTTAVRNQLTQLLEQIAPTRRRRSAPRSPGWSGTKRRAPRIAGSPGSS